MSATYTIIRAKRRGLELKRGPEVISSIQFAGRPSVEAEGALGEQRLKFEPKGWWNHTITFRLNNEVVGRIAHDAYGEVSADLVLEGVERRILLVHTSYFRGGDMALTFQDVPFISFHMRPRWFGWPDYDVRTARTDTIVQPSPLLLTIGSYMITVERLLRGRG